MLLPRAQGSRGRGGAIKGDKKRPGVSPAAGHGRASIQAACLSVCFLLTGIQSSPARFCCTAWPPAYIRGCLDLRPLWGFMVRPEDGQVSRS